MQWNIYDGLVCFKRNGPKIEIDGNMDICSAVLEDYLHCNASLHYNHSGTHRH